MNKLLLVLALLFPASTIQAQVEKMSLKLNEGATLTLERIPFKAVGKALKFYESKVPHTSKFLVSIDGQPVFGTDGDLPRYVLSKAVLSLNGRAYNLQVKNMYNPWFGSTASEFVTLTRIGSTCKLRAVFSDGAGSYLVEWKVSGNSAVRTLLTADDEIVTAFFTKSAPRK